LRASLFGQKPGEEQPDILATHPSTPERVSRAIAAARQIGAPGIGSTGRDEYLNAIDGIDFGDDPSEGFVRGRRFIHPKLGFSFTAPEGFVLENSAQALLGIAAGGAEALRLDSVHVPATTTLESYLGSGWIEGLDTTSIQTADFNGMPAAIATAKGGEWRFRLAAVRVGAEVYRVIFATRSLSSTTDARFMEALQSFRKLAGDEAQRTRPLRLTLVRAEENDTADKLATRMAVPDRPLEHFLLLNGLETGTAVKPGQRYKLVVE
ncbi:MAG: peptidase Ste24p, partial [Hyphomicrobiales bacterium]|nr:peptidase Ste24p [Hyphomicrobiales bacterium]